MSGERNARARLSMRWLVWMCPVLTFSAGYLMSNFMILTDSRPAAIEKLILSFADVARLGEASPRIFGPSASGAIKSLLARGIDFGHVEIEPPKVSVVDPLDFEATLRVGKPENAAELTVQGSCADVIQAVAER